MFVRNLSVHEEFSEATWHESKIFLETLCLIVRNFSICEEFGNTTCRDLLESIILLCLWGIYLWGFSKATWRESKIFRNILCLIVRNFSICEEFGNTICGDLLESIYCYVCEEFICLWGIFKTEHGMRVRSF